MAESSAPIATSGSSEPGPSASSTVAQCSAHSTRGRRSGPRRPHRSAARPSAAGRARSARHRGGNRGRPSARIQSKHWRRSGGASPQTFPSLPASSLQPGSDAHRPRTSACVPWSPRPAISSPRCREADIRGNCSRGQESILKKTARPERTEPDQRRHYRPLTSALTARTQTGAPQRSGLSLSEAPTDSSTPNKSHPINRSYRATY